MNGTDNITQQNKKSITMPNQSQPTKQEIISVFKELGFKKAGTRLYNYSNKS